MNYYKEIKNELINNEVYKRVKDYSKKAEKIKEQVDELVQELMAAKSAPVVSKRSLKVADINFENEDVNTLMQIQARLARVILEKSK